VIADAPADARALNAYGYLLAEARADFAGALPYLERAHALQPDSAPILDSLGWVTLRLGRHARALELLREAWVRGKDPEIAAHFGEALWIAGERDEARAVWQAGRVLDPDHPALKRVLEKYPK
jgi:Flp pilus assembly protein TadD